jgi:hypothetical protein
MPLPPDESNICYRCEYTLGTHILEEAPYLPICHRCESDRQEYYRQVQRTLQSTAGWTSMLSRYYRNFDYVFVRRGYRRSRCAWIITS